ncbi:hypothetical protein NMT12_120107 [metagenome]
MSNYYKSYTEFCNKNMNIQFQTIKDNIHHYPIVEDLLGFHYWLDEKVAPIYNKTEDYDKQHMSEAFIHISFSHNILSFYTIFLTLEKSLIHQLNSHMRTVLESIPKMCYLSFYPDDVNDIIIKDRISGINDDEKKRNELDKFKTESSFPAFQNFNSDEAINRIKGKYYFKWFLDKVYNEETKKAFSTLYHHLSNSTHSSFMRHQIQYDKELTNKIFEDVELLLFYNLVAEIEGHKRMINSKLFPIKESMVFMEKMRALLVKDGKLASLFPDHPDILSKVMIHPPGYPWE